MSNPIQETNKNLRNKTVSKALLVFFECSNVQSLFTKKLKITATINPIPFPKATDVENNSTQVYKTNKSIPVVIAPVILYRINRTHREIGTLVMIRLM